MLTSKQRTIIECGFEPPAAEFVKQDPRGEEYGYFQVLEPSLNSNESQIRVFKRDRGGRLLWGCRFDDQISFGHWAKDNT